jgi:hypothetical protein
MTNKDQIDKLRNVQNTLRSATIEEIVNGLPYFTHRHLAANELLARTIGGETIYEMIVKDYIARSAKNNDPALLEDKSEARPNGEGV